METNLQELAELVGVDPICTTQNENIRQYFLTFDPNSCESVLTEEAVVLPYEGTEFATSVLSSVEETVTDTSAGVIDEMVDDNDNNYTPKRRNCYKIDCEFINEARAIVVGKYSVTYIL